jgi:hypothetical protein
MGRNSSNLVQNTPLSTWCLSLSHSPVLTHTHPYSPHPLASCDPSSPPHRTGRPGPVLVDVPKDIQQQLAVPDWDVPMAITGYMSRLPPPPEPKQLAAVVAAIKAAKKPVGGGCCSECAAWLHRNISCSGHAAWLHRTTSVLSPWCAALSHHACTTSWPVVQEDLLL